MLFTFGHLLKKISFSFPCVLLAGWHHLYPYLTHAGLQEWTGYTHHTHSFCINLGTKCAVFCFDSCAEYEHNGRFRECRAEIKGRILFDGMQQKAMIERTSGMPSFRLVPPAISQVRLAAGGHNWSWLGWFIKPSFCSLLTVSIPRYAWFFRWFF